MHSFFVSSDMQLSLYARLLLRSFYLCLFLAYAPHSRGVFLFGKETAVSEGKEPIALFNCRFVYFKCLFLSDKRRHQHNERGLGKMEIGYQPFHALEPVRRINEYLGIAFARFTKPFSSATVSSTLTDVVPTAITRLPSRFARLIFSAVASSIS